MVKINGDESIHKMNDISTCTEDVREL